MLYAEGEYLRSVRDVRLCPRMAGSGGSKCANCPTPLREERPYSEEYFDLRARPRECRDANGADA
jgi:hypothetical protein